MTALPVIYSPLAERQLAELRRYIEATSGANRAATYVDAVIDYCDGLTTFPKRGQDVTTCFWGFGSSVTVAV